MIVQSYQKDKGVINSEGIRHSRLLKYILQNKMADTKYKYDYKEPENVQSEVPGQQNLREGANDSAIAKLTETEDNLDNPGDYNLVPVMTVTKKEATLTKGDMKLQKVSVQENISDKRNGVTLPIEESAYQYIVSEVPTNHQPIRMEGNQEERRTRIPMRFKNAVNRVRRERSVPDRKDIETALSLHPRRSSIPRLKTSVRSPKPEDEEFEKIYDEIVDSSINLDISLLNNKVDDPIKVENSFEEIIHDYDEGKMKPISVEKPKSKIPMLKRKSEAEIVVPVNVDSTTKNNSFDENKIQDPITKVTKDDEVKSKKIPSRIAVSKKYEDEGKTKGVYQRSTSKSVSNDNKHTMEIENVSIKFSYENDIGPENVLKIDDITVKSIGGRNIEIVELNPVVETEFHSIIEEINLEPSIIEIVESTPSTTPIIDTNNNNNVYIEEIVENDAPINQDIEGAHQIVSPVKVVKLDFDKHLTRDLKIDNMSEETPKIETNKNGAIKGLDEHVDNNKDTVRDTVIQSVTLNPKRLDTDINKNGSDDDNDTPILRGKVNRMINRLHSNGPELKKESIQELPKPKSVLSKIALFERHEPKGVNGQKPKETKIPKFHSRPKQEFKPKIVDEVLKPVQRNSIENNNDTRTESIRNLDINKKSMTKDLKAETLIVEDIALEKPLIVETIIQNEIIPDIYSSTPIQEKKPKNSRREITIENVSEILLKPIEIEYIETSNINTEADNTSKEYKVEEITLNPIMETAQYDVKIEKSETAFEYQPSGINNKDFNEPASLDYVLDRLNNFKSSFEDSNLKKSKSVAELDLGDAVKGKVNQMILRMQSIDRVGVEKKEVIGARERPRKKSVSEKIALFEGKLNQGPSQNPPPHDRRVPKPAQPQSPENIEAKLKELREAKTKYGKMKDMVYMTMNNGLEIPLLGLGTALLDNALCKQIVMTAIDLGYRAIDTAYIYGNEKIVGEAIAAKIEDGTIRREDLFITSKLWSNCHRKDLVEDACRKSLEVMGLNYVDLYLIHNPMSFKEGQDPLPRIAGVLQYSDHDYLDAWFGMERLVTLGIAKSVGVSNFNSVQLQRILDRARVKPVVNMVESHPYLCQKRLREYCADRNVKLLCYGVLGSKGTPAEYKSSTDACIDDPLVQVMAAGLGVTPAQLLIRYQLEMGHAAVVKASSGARLWDDLQALKIRLDDGQVEALQALNRNRRSFTFKGMGDTHKNYPFNVPF